MERASPLLSTFQWVLLSAVVATCEDSLMTQRLTLQRIGRVSGKEEPANYRTECLKMVRYDGQR
jgi:hypothetical protein